MIIDEALARECPRPGLALELTTRDPLVKKALLTMQQTLDTTLTVADLAARLDVSRRKLEPHFTETLQVTAWEAGKMIRLAQARLLLKRSERSVTEIANDAGFADVSHLIRVFRAAEGITPEVWRQLR